MLSIRGSEGTGGENRPVIKKESYDAFFSKSDSKSENTNSSKFMPTIQETGDNEEMMDENQEYDDIIGSAEAFVEYRDADNQTMPIKLERLNARQEVRVDKILDGCMLRDELMILQFPHSLPALVYKSKENNAKKSGGMDEESDEDDDFDVLQGTCDNYPQGRFGTIKIWEHRDTGAVRSRFELCTKEKDQEEAVQVKFDVHSTHDSLVAQELFTIQPPRDDIMVDEKKPEIVVLGACTKKLVCTPIVK